MTRPAGNSKGLPAVLQGATDRRSAGERKEKVRGACSQDVDSTDRERRRVLHRWLGPHSQQHRSLSFIFHPFLQLFVILWEVGSIVLLLRVCMWSLKTVQLVCPKPKWDSPNNRCYFVIKS